MAVPYTGSKWGPAGLGSAGGPVSWSFAASAGSFYGFEAAIATPAYQQAIRLAFLTWEKFADIDFVEIADSAVSNIRLGFDTLDGPRGQIGQSTWLKAGNRISHSEIAFDLAETWSVGPVSGAMNLLTVAIHEIGHSIGLAHSDDIGSIMYPALSGEERVSAADIAAIQGLYGPSLVVEPIVGTNGADELSGTDRGERIDGRDGNDTIRAGGGADQIVGGAGDDQLFGGAGDDRLSGNDGADRLDGGEGDDHLDGAVGDDILEGGAGRDVVDGGLGDDRLSGGDGEDYLHGGLGHDWLAGGAGNDVLDGAGGDDRLDGGAGDDWVGGGEGDDAIEGGAGNDGLSGGRGDDVLSDAIGRNVFYGGDGNDTLLGGADSDRLFGDAGEDRIVGHLGRDIMKGGDGNDIFVFETPEDSLAGAALRDRILDFATGDRIDLSALGVDGADSGDDATASLVFVGTDAFSAAGQIRYVFSASGHTIVQANLDADTASTEFEIELTGTRWAFVADDFILI